VALNYRSVVGKHQALVDIALNSLLQQRIVMQPRVARVEACITVNTGCESRAMRSAWRHWQASQSGLSMEQNLMSLAGSLAAEVAAIGAVPPPIDTALSAPGATVLFSL
jgi:hypothetical protein